MLLSSHPLEMYENLAQKNPEVKFYFFITLLIRTVLCFLLSSNEHKEPISMKCYDIWDLLQNMRGGEIDEIKQTTIWSLGNSGSWARDSSTSAYVKMTTWVGSLYIFVVTLSYFKWRKLKALIQKASCTSHQAVGKTRVVGHYICIPGTYWHPTGT